MFETIEQLVEAIYSTLPYSGQIKNLKFHDGNKVTFNWRSNKFVVTIGGDVNELIENDSLQAGSDICILFRKMLKTTYVYAG